MILVGSRAAQYHLPNFRKAKDWDLIAPLKLIFAFATKYANDIEFMHPKNEWKFVGKLRTGDAFEIEVADYNASAQFLWDRRIPMSTRRCNLDAECAFERMALEIPDLGFLTKMKRSHLYWNVHWDKSIADYHHFLPLVKGFDEEHEEFYKLRLAENEAKWGKTKVNLDQTNDEFFAKSRKVGRVFDHDVLHEAVKYYDVPLYSACKKNHDSAMLDRTLFELWYPLQQQRLVREEAMAIALERVVIPKVINGEDYDATDAYQYALRRICTNLATGWFRDFAIENWNHINTPDVDYVAKFREHFLV